MSQIFKKTFAVFALIAAVLIASTSTAFASTTEDCATATPLELDSTYRGLAGEGTEIFALSIPAAGIVALDVTVPGTAQIEPKLGFLGHGCSTAADPDAATIEKSVAHQTIAFRAPGEYYIRVAAQDPRQSLGKHRVHVSFAAADVVDDFFEMDLGADHRRASVRQSDFFITTATKVEEEEVDPDPSAAGARRILGLFTLYESTTEKVEEEEVDPDPTLTAANVLRKLTGNRVPDPQKVEEEEVDPDPTLLADGAMVLDSFVMIYGRTEKVEEEEVDPDPTLRLDELCRRSVSDDHGDVAACATPVAPGTAARGILADDRDDADVFTFTLASPQTLEIATAGDGDTRGALYDSFGNRLAVDDDGGAGGNFRIVKSLGAGRYFVRVEGAGGSRAAFELTVEPLPW